jgi:pulcherriminic acid synthase
VGGSFEASWKAISTAGRATIEAGSAPCPVANFVVGPRSVAATRDRELARLREETPIFWHEELGAFCVTRYDDVKEVLTDGTRFLMSAPGLTNSLPGMLPLMDGSSHAALRELVTPAFSTATIRRTVQPTLDASAHSLIDRFARVGSTELIESFANPFPAFVIQRMLQIRDFDLMQFLRDGRIMVDFLSNPSDPEIASEFPEATRRQMELFEAVVADERRKPRGGVVSMLAEAELAGRHLSDEELVNFCYVLTGAGMGTSQVTIGNVVFELSANPSERAKVIDEPGLVPSAVEEVLRLHPPAQFRMRYAAEDLELCSVTVPRGSLIYAFASTANRDPEKFADPDRFLAGRYADRNTTPHLTFGWGAHFCIGAFLARLEVQHAVRALYERLHDLRTDSDAQLTFRGFRVPSLERLPVRFRPEG